MSEEENGQIHIDEQDASAGRKPGVVRWVLLISMISLILIFVIILFVAPAMAPDSGGDYGAADMLENASAFFA
ncbi:hypothetical protein [Aurantiacibacter gilvus]|uniref:Uncharacterized protein n=1 Tax=Aurantiacibacter gilvus TaxID=3139141 RepID=A0ABU9IFP9_9SPHN